MAAVPPHEKDVDIDIGHLARAVWRRKVLVGLATVAFAGAAFATAGLIPPVYKSDTQIVIEDRESAYTRPATGTASSDSLNAESVESQVSLITSDGILGEVAERFKLADRAEYAPGKSLLDRVITRIQPATRVTSGEVIETMHKKLNVYRKENTRVLVVEFSSHDPALARDVPNAIAAEYLARQKGALLSSNTSATGWLEEEIADLRKAVKAAEERVAGFRASSDLLVGQNQGVLANQQLSEMSSELSRTRAARAAAEGRAQSVREALERGLPLDSIAEVLGAPTVQALRERQVALRSEIADLSTTLLDNHPRLRSLRSQLRDIDAEVTREATKVQSSLETQADSARQRETALASEMDRLKAEAARAGTEEVELRSLEREAESQSQLLESYLTRYREAVARGSRDYLPVDARVFSEARMPAEPYFPKIVPITAAAGVAGFLVAALGILVVEIFSGRALQPAPSASPREAQLRDEEAQLRDEEAQLRDEEAQLRDEKAASREEAKRHEETAFRDETASVPALPAAAVAAADAGDDRPADAPSPHAVPAAPVPDQGLPADAPAGGEPVRRDEVVPLPSKPAAPASIPPGDLAEAMMTSGIERVVVLPVDAERSGALALARSLAGRSASVVLIDLGGLLWAEMGLDREAPGLCDLGTEGVGIAEIIHRDRDSPVNAIGAGRAPAELSRAELLEVYAALAAAYDFTVVACGEMEPASLAAVMDEEAALVVSHAPGEIGPAAERLAALQAAGHGDVLLMTAGEAGDASASRAA